MYSVANDLFIKIQKNLIFNTNTIIFNHKQHQMAKLLLITSNNILPFTIDNITQCSGDEFLSQNNNEIFKNLN